MSVGHRDRLPALAALAEPLRRDLYLHVVAAAAPVSREAAAEALGVARSVAAFHLDKLTEVGLLEVEYRRPPGRGGPGAGRPAKLYRPVADELAFTVPARRYDLAASVLAQAVADAASHAVPIGDALRAAARHRGHSMAAPLEGEDGEPPPPSGRTGALERVAELLRSYGYEPQLDGDRVLLENCPFHALAEQHRDLVCGMNLELVEGVLEGMDVEDVEARLDPAPGRCCVTLRSG